MGYTTSLYGWFEFINRLFFQVNLEEPQGILLSKGPTSSSSTTQGAKLAAPEGVGIAQPPLAGAIPAPPNQPEFVHQIGREDVMEAPSLNDPPVVKQLPQHHPLHDQQQQQHGH